MHDCREAGRGDNERAGGERGTGAVAEGDQPGAQTAVMAGAGAPASTGSGAGARSSCSHARNGGVQGGVLCADDGAALEGSLSHVPGYGGTSTDASTSTLIGTPTGVFVGTGVGVCAGSRAGSESGSSGRDRAMEAAGEGAGETGVKQKNGRKRATER
eukprot:6174971-Pleurochrysis_carterae.AAC.2